MSVRASSEATRIWSESAEMMEQTRFVSADALDALVRATRARLTESVEKEAGREVGVGQRHKVCDRRIDLPDAYLQARVAHAVGDDARRAKELRVGRLELGMCRLEIDPGVLRVQEVLACQVPRQLLCITGMQFAETKPGDRANDHAVHREPDSLQWRGTRQNCDTRRGDARSSLQTCQRLM